MSDPHSDDLPPSPWVIRHAGLVPPRGDVLDLAAGSGRHTRLFLQRAHLVVAVDKRTEPLKAIRDAGLEIVTADLEAGGPWPLGVRRFAGIVVTNYLHRPLFPEILAALAPGGALIYETFALGNERFGKPSNPDFLLRPGELQDAVRGRLQVIAFEELEVTTPKPAMVQRIAAIAS